MIITLTTILSSISLVCLLAVFYLQRKTDKMYKNEADRAHEFADLQKKFYEEVCNNGVCKGLYIEHSYTGLYYELSAYFDWHRVLIKQFHYSPNDEESKKFAYRRAEELKDMMEENLD